MEDYELQTEQGQAPDTADDTLCKYLLFRSDALLFGAAADYVVEIITNHPITPDSTGAVLRLRHHQSARPDHSHCGYPHYAGTDAYQQRLHHHSHHQRHAGGRFGGHGPADDRSGHGHPVHVLRLRSTSVWCPVCASLPDGETMLEFDCANLLTQA